VSGRRRSKIVLGVLVGVALANGILVGLTAYGVLAVVLRLLGSHGPGIAWGLAAGALLGLGLLAFALREERYLREGAYGPWQFAGADDPTRPPIVSRLEALVAASTLNRGPSLWLLDNLEPNAFTVGRSREEAAIVVTTGLTELLTPEEEDAVLAHQIAHIEADDVRAGGLADAIVISMDELSHTRRRVLWGPRRIVAETAPFLAAALALVIVVPILTANEDAVAVNGLVSLGLLIAIVWTALRCWPGLVQLFLFFFFFGPLSLIEMVLAVPTAFVLSRLLSRTRIAEADARAAQLCGDPAALIAALEKLVVVERSPEEPWVGGLRFALFVTPRPQFGYRRLLARLDATHPRIADRIDALRELTAQDGSRVAADGRQPGHSLEQSG
jgi:Zn-dependent protease with chaperone function